MYGNQTRWRGWFPYISYKTSLRRRGIFIVFNAFPLHFSLTSCVSLAFPSLTVSVSVSRSLARSLPLYLPPSPLSLSVSVYLSTMCQYVSSNTLSNTHTQPASSQDIRALCSLAHLWAEIRQVQITYILRFPFCIKSLMKIKIRRQAQKNLTWTWGCCWAHWSRHSPLLDTCFALRLCMGNIH